MHISDYVVANNETLYVITGLAYDDIKNPTVKYGTAVPTYFYKAICSPSKGQSVGKYGKNINVNIPEGMDKFISIEKLESEKWIKSLFKEDFKFFGDECYKNGELNMGDSVQLNKLAKIKRDEATPITPIDDNCHYK